MIIIVGEASEYNSEQIDTPNEQWVDAMKYSFYTSSAFGT